MKKAVCILLLVVLGITQTPMGQLLKIPLLIEHFSGHKKSSGVSFFQFFQGHYLTDHNDGDREEDQRLPFKSTVLQQLDIAVVPENVNPELIIEVVFSEELKARNMCYLPQQRFYSIFHPPCA